MDAAPDVRITFIRHSNDKVCLCRLNEDALERVVAMRHYHKFLTIAFLLLLAGFLFVSLVVYSPYTANNSPAWIVGTWKSEHGTMTEFRRDGAMRQWSTKDQAKEIENFRYELVGNKLMIMRAAAPNQYLRRFREAVFGLGKVTYLVTALNDDEFVIEDPFHGEKGTVRRTQDESPETVP
jgi:hypothetical protein